MIQPIQVMIVGAQKAGTTSLFQYIAQNPSICTHPQREMVYFVNDEVYASGYETAYAKYFKPGNNNGSVLLAKHVMAMYSQDALARIHKHNPNMYLIVVLRNPVDRAYSAYWYARRRGWENIKTFEGALEAESERMKEGWYTWRNCAYVHNGIYHRYLEWILEKFGKNQVLILTSDELTNDAGKICRGIYETLKLDSTFVSETIVRHNTSCLPRSEFLAQTFSRLLANTHPLKRFARSLIPGSFTYKIRHKILKLNEKGFTPPEMKRETRYRLAEYFKPYNDTLEKLLGRDFHYWNHI
ncbi:MAG: hypothetical protein E3K32_13535 [wastewater metagenome]|nr:hypothetical protein [Candidatus Loosdrechtia aerotolerans]